MKKKLTAADMHDPQVIAEVVAQGCIEVVEP